MDLELTLTCFVTESISRTKISCSCRAPEKENQIINDNLSFSTRASKQKKIPKDTHQDGKVKQQAKAKENSGKWKISE